MEEEEEEEEGLLTTYECRSVGATRCRVALPHHTPTLRLALCHAARGTHRGVGWRMRRSRGRRRRRKVYSKLTQAEEEEEEEESLFRADAVN